MFSINFLDGRIDVLLLHDRQTPPSLYYKSCFGFVAENETPEVNPRNATLTVPETNDEMTSQIGQVPHAAFDKGTFSILLSQYQHRHKSLKEASNTNLTMVTISPVSTKDIN